MKRGRHQHHGIRIAMALAIIGLGSHIAWIETAKAAALEEGTEVAAAAQERTSPEPKAADVVVTTRLEPSPAYIGDLLTYEVSAGYPAGLTINLPIGVGLGEFEIVGVEQGVATSTGDGFRRTFTFTLQVFKLGALTVPGFELTAVNTSGEIETVSVPPATIVIDTLTVNEADPQRRGEERPVSPPFPNDLAAWSIYGALLAGLFVLLGWLAHRRFGRSRAVAPGPPPVPPDEIALAALAELEERRVMMLEDGAFGDYYLELTDIAKGYVEGRFGVFAMDRTTDELRDSLLGNEVSLDPVDPRELLAFLDRCDLVKFARLAPAPEEAAADLHSVRVMVESTESERARIAAGNDASDDGEFGDGDASDASDTGDAGERAVIRGGDGEDAA